MCQEEVRAPVERNGRLFCPVEDCPHEYATETGYKTRGGYRKHYRRYHLQSEKVGIISRSDLGSSGSRRGLFERAFRIFRREEVEFIVFAGGLTSNPHLKGRFTQGALDDLWAETWGIEYAGRQRPARKERVTRAREKLLDRWADKLAEVIPQLKVRGRYVKIYIVTAPATNYDGKTGTEIARRLVRRRPDILLWGEGSARFHLKRQATVFGVVTAKKRSWGSKYFSAAVDRLINDKEKQTAEVLPDLWVVGCTASTLQRPQGERKRPYISIPALHRLEEVHTAENQVGATVVEFLPPTNSERNFLVRNYEFKDLTAGEFRGMPDPPASFDLGQRIIDVLREKPATIGMFEDELHVPRGQIAKEIERLNASAYEPKIVYIESSQQYRFSPRWIRENLRYKDPTTGFVEDRLLAFSCLHAGSPFTEHRFFVEEVPKLILQHEVETLAGAGDFIQGLEHDLDKRGEVILGLNYTQQEELAAKLIGEVILRVFRARFITALPKPHEERKPRVSKARLRRLIDTSLISFFYREGNHDAWLERKGVTPLTTFYTVLADTITGGIEQEVAEKGLRVPPDVKSIVEQKIQKGERHTLPSGLGITIYHPNMARALTSSLRIQQALDASDDQVVVAGNFHVAISAGQWESELGQKLGLQVGTILWKSKFEHGKLKRLDTGVTVARILSRQGRICMTEILFSNEGVRRETHTNEDFLKDFLEQLGIQ
jgi:hypothetical protein